MWFEDLTPYAYCAHPEYASAPGPVLNVGWLENGHAFPTGVVPSSVVERIRLLVDHASTRAMRGLHYCDLCPPGDEDLEWSDPRLNYVRSSAEIIAVGADGTRYAAPVLVYHYVVAHQYRPPQVFIDAVMQKADLTWEAARAQDLCLSCGAAMPRSAPHRGWRGPNREPVVTFDFDCATCGAAYSRQWPDTGEVVSK